MNQQQLKKFGPTEMQMNGEKLSINNEYQGLENMKNWDLIESPADVNIAKAVNEFFLNKVEF